MSRVDRNFNNEDDFWGDSSSTDRARAKKEYKKARKKEKRKHSFLRKLIVLIIVLGFLGCAAGAGYAYMCISSAEVIHPETIYETIDLSSYIYDDEGNQIETVYYDQNRKLAKFDELPDNLLNAFIAIEDKTFWTHHGFNFKRIIGAILQSITGDGISGTSTITQQLARNVYLSDTMSVRSIKRKIIEMYYAYEIEQTLSKEEIIEAYLNTIYLGYGNYGVTSAAKTYFSSSVEDLTLEQCAALAALPQAPDAYALIKSEEDEYTTAVKNIDGCYANDRAEERRNLVLYLMKEQGYITDEEKEAATKPLIDFIKPNLGTESSTRSYFKDYLISTVISDLMEQYDKTEDEARNMVYTQGLKIYSTLDSQAQKIAAKEFKKASNFPDTVKGDTPQGAMVIVEVGTGQINAMIGGRNPNGEMLYNRAINPRQPGSSIKPLAVYAAALQKSYELQAKGEKYEYNEYVNASEMGEYITAGSVIQDNKMVVNGQVWPGNNEGYYSGTNTFRTGIQGSINTIAVKILMQVGIDYSAQLVKAFGISTLCEDEDRESNDLNLASLALGGLTYGVTPLDMALAYATFPNGGVRNSGICYTTVEDREGNVILEAKSEETKVLDEGVAWVMTDVLKSVVSDGGGRYAAIDGVQVGGKTGTTESENDIWFDGFTPHYAASLWIGADDNVSLTTMSISAQKLWSKIMNKVDKAKKGKYKSKPDNVVEVNGEYYTKGTEPTSSKLENDLPDSDTRTDTMDDETETDTDADSDKEKDKDKDTE